METIYGIQSDTATLREAHERQKRISQQRLQEQKSGLLDPKKSHAATVGGSSMKVTASTLEGPPKPSLVARSTSASALPSRALQQKQQHQQQEQVQEQNNHHSQHNELHQKLLQQQQRQQQYGQLHNQRSAVEEEYSSPLTAATAAAAAAAVASTSSPFLSAVLDSKLHHYHTQSSAMTPPPHGGNNNTSIANIGTHNYSFPTAATLSKSGTSTSELRSATQSPAFLAKRLYDSEHRMPWLALPGSAAAAAAVTTGQNHQQQHGSSIGGDVSPSLFMGGGGGGGGGVGGRRRSDVGLGHTSGPLALTPQQQDNTSVGGGGISTELAGTIPSHASHHHHHHHHPHHLTLQSPRQHLLSQQDVANLSRHGSPMPLNEALPHYLRAGQRKTSVESLQLPSSSTSSSSMERSSSSPGTTGGGVNASGKGGNPLTTQASSFVLPMSPAVSAAAAAGLGAHHHQQQQQQQHTPIIGALRSSNVSGVSSLSGSGSNTPIMMTEPGSGSGTAVGAAAAGTAIGSSALHQTNAPSHLLFTFPSSTSTSTSHTSRPIGTERGSLSTVPLPIHRSGWLDPQAHHGLGSGIGPGSISGSTTPLGANGINDNGNNA
ncbi:hypothetical protein BG004_003160 [Podila humilis]|nr:hypothetical protein BG004_003160 [Podila humilis]